MSKSFNLESFKNGKKALTRDGRVATFVGVCEKCPNNEKLIAHINWDDNITSYSLRGTYRSSKESDYDLVSMVSRHQHLIDSYDPEDTWQFSVKTYDEWFDIEGKPEWEENREFRLHPHNDLIKAWKKGAKIEACISSVFIEVDNPEWGETITYRIKPEPVIHCLAYNTRIFKKDATGLATPMVVTKDIAQSNGWTIIQEWEVCF